jgi:hypothetical protein
LKAGTLPRLLVGAKGFCAFGIARSFGLFFEHTLSPRNAKRIRGQWLEGCLPPTGHLLGAMAMLGKEYLDAVVANQVTRTDGHKHRAWLIHPAI